jgi:Raf kinase inhibitor-like YbhB/YbcL family protein
MTASRHPAALCLSILALAATPLVARAAGGDVAVAQAQLKGGGASLQVSIPDVSSGGALPLGYTADGRNVSPALNWTPGPRGTRSYAVVLQDPDAPPAEPAVHWLVWNIPRDVTSLPKSMRNVDSPANPLGSAQGQNYHGSVGYSGPRPPPGDSPHHYHFQVFALNRMVKVRPGSQPRAVLAAMADHVLASGELVATFAAPVPKSPKATAAPPG